MSKPVPYQDKTEQRVVTKRVYDCIRVAIDMSDDEDPFDCDEKSFQVRLDDDGIFLSWQNGHGSSLKVITIPFDEFHKEVGEFIDRMAKKHSKGKGGLYR